MVIEYVSIRGRSKRFRDAKGRLHRDGGLPAVEHTDGSKSWWIHGKRHRDGDLPAVEWAHGWKKWCIHGEIHREGDLPAMTDNEGTKWWFKRDKLHRDGDLPAIEWANGIRMWAILGKRHRDRGQPAFDFNNGYSEWYFWGKKLTGEHALRIHRLLCNRAYRQRWRKVRRLVELAKTRAFIEWFYRPDQLGGKWAKKDIDGFVHSLVMS